jgi:hypothetical protein
METNTKNIITISVAGVALYFIAKFGSSMLQKLNITESLNEKEATKIIESNPIDNPFNPLYWKNIKASGNKKKVKILKIAVALSHAKKLRNAVGYLSSDFSQILNVFQSLQSKSQVSFLCDYFAKKYNDNLFQYLKAGYKLPIGNTGLSEKDLKTLINYVNKLPSGLY